MTEMPDPKPISLHVRYVERGRSDAPGGDGQQVFARCPVCGRIAELVDDPIEPRVQCGDCGWRRLIEEEQCSEGSRGDG